MLPGTGPCARIVQLAGLAFGQRDQFLHRADAGFRVRHQHVVDKRDLRHADEVAQGVVRQLLQVRGRHERRRVDRKGVAVGRALREQVGADRAARAPAVVDHHRLPPLLGELAPEHPADDVERAARRERHDQPHRSGRKIRRKHRHRRESDKRDENFQKDSRHAAFRRPSRSSRPAATSARRMRSISSAGSLTSGGRTTARGNRPRSTSASFMRLCMSTNGSA